MQLAHQILVLVHLVGFAALLGGVLVQARTTHPEITTTMLWGSWVELVTGVALVVLVLTADDPLSWWPTALKLAVTTPPADVGSAHPAAEPEESAMSIPDVRR